MEQVKVDVAYSHTNVKLIGISGGISYGALGMTHHSAQDIAALASIPGLRVYLPSDRFLTQALLEVLVEDNDPAYIRVGRNAVEDVYDSVPENFQMDKALTVREGTDVTLIACGELVRPALDAALLLEEKGISARVIDMYCVKSLDREAVLQATRETKAIVTAEEANVVGGLGSAVAEFLAAHPKVASVSYCGLPGDKYHALAEKYLPHGTCGVVSFELKGGREAAGTFMKHLKLAAIETHVADARTCCLNPASSTHRQMTDKQLAAAGIPAGLVRMSCGLESKQDLIGDIAQALDQVK